MTIPVMPGPFSFLANLGQAGGAAFQAAERDRQKRTDEDWNFVDYLFKAAKLRNDPSILASPQAMEAYSRLGISPPSPKPTAEEQIGDIQGRFLADQETPGFQMPIPGLIGPTPSINVKPTGGFISTGQRMAAGLPLKSAIEREETVAPVVNRAEGAKAQLGAATDTALLPGAELSAIANQQGEQDKTFNEAADRIVLDRFIANGFTLPTPEEAFAAGQTDPRLADFSTAMTQPYYGAAIARLQDRLAVLDIQRMAANARAMGIQGDQFTDLLRIMLGQQANNINLMKNIPEPTATDRGMATAYEMLIGEAKSPQKLQEIQTSPRYDAYRKAKARVDSYNQFIQQSQGQTLGTGDDITETVRSQGGLPGVRTPGDRSGRQYSDQAVDALVEEMIKTAGPTDDLEYEINQAARAGKIRASDAAVMISRLKELDRLQGRRRTPRRPSPLDTAPQPSTQRPQ